MNRLFPCQIILCLILVSGMQQGCAKIKPDEIGVRTVNFSQGKGVVQQDFGPGCHRFLWPLDSWNRFPRTVQRIQFHKDLNQSGIETFPPLVLTSADGDRVTLNAEVLYRIAEGKAHFVLQDSGKGRQFETVVQNLSIDAARAAFGKLKTESFYNPEQREAVRKSGMKQLQKRLEPRGIELINFLVLSVEFDPEYENLIKQKKIADQKVDLEKSKTRAAEERGKVDMVKQETSVKIGIIQRETESKILQMRTEADLQIALLTAEANQYATQKRADADLYKAQKDAQGHLMVKTAEAEGTQRLNEALAGDGGQNLATLEAVKNMQLRDVVFPSTGFDWFNPIEMAKKLGAEEKLPAKNKERSSSTSDATTLPQRDNQK